MQILHENCQITIFSNEKKKNQNVVCWRFYPAGKRYVKFMLDDIHVWMYENLTCI